MRWEKRKTLVPELRQRPWRRMTSYYDSTYRRLEQYFTWNSEESLTNALDIFLHKSFAYYHKYILRYFMWLLQKLRYQLRHSFLRQELLQHKYIFVLIVHSDGEDYRILFEKSFYQKKLKSVFSTMTTEFYCLCLEQWNSIIWQVRFS